MKTMHMSSLKESVEVFSRHASRLVEKLQEKVNKEEFDIHPYLNLTTINTFLGTLYYVFSNFTLVLF